MEERKWFLELSLEGQFDNTIKEHVYYPLYFNNYEDAIRIILLKILRDKRERAETDERFSYVITDEEGYIIPFLGRRGSGKTTVMVEFCKILEKLNDREEYQFWLEHAVMEDDLRETLKLEKFQFRTLHRIDVSSLENKEDLFELLMSELYQFYQNVRPVDYVGGRSRDIHVHILEQFNEIMKAYYAIRDSREDEFGDSYVSKLGYMSSSFSIREQIRELTEDLFERVLNCRDNYFIVIAIDDLDLNVSKGYEMLEQLHKYFLNEHMLITLSADYEQLNRICKFHYIRDFSTGRSHVIESLVTDSCSELARDYITKMLPIDSRIFLPDWNKMVRKILINLDDDCAVPVKEYVMGRLAQKMEIFHDINGLKKHFVEQNTVRELAKYNQLLESLLDIPYDAWRTENLPVQLQMDYMERYDQNHDRYNNDILNRLANQLLTEAQRSDFQKLIGLDLERRAEAVCSTMFETLTGRGQTEKQGENNGNNSIEHLKDAIQEQMENVLEIESGDDGKIQNHDKNGNATKGLGRSGNTSKSDGTGTKGEDVYDWQYEYGFGYLLQGIYEYGRMSEANKAFIKCVLASFTSEIVREKISQERNPSETSRERSFRRMNRFLGNSVGNPWLADVIPQLDDSSVPNSKVGYSRLELVGTRDPENILPIKKSILDVLTTNSFSQKTTGEIEKELDPLRKKMTEWKTVASFEFLRLFVTVQKQDEWREFPFEFHIEETANILGQRMQEKYALQVQLKNQPAVISIWEFIGKTVNLRRYLENFHEMLAAELSKVFCEKKGLADQLYIGILKEIFLGWIKEDSMFRSYLNNGDTDVFPFYDLDLAYNVMKRVRRERIRENPYSISKHEIFSYIGKAYTSVKKHLEEEDKGYKAVDEKLRKDTESHNSVQIVSEFALRFERFPFVKIIMDGSFQTSINKGIINMLEVLLTRDIVPQQVDYIDY